jgi:hypothetical protein
MYEVQGYTDRRSVMNKIIFFAAALFVFSFAAISFAIPAAIPADSTQAVARGGTQVTIGGELRVRGVNTQNTSDFNGHAAAGTALVRLKGRLKANRPG